jgi:sulfur-carrier protein
MKTVFRIPRILQQYCEGASELSLEGMDVGELLADLSRRYPEVYRCVCNEAGVVRPHIHLFVNNDLVSIRDGFRTRIEAGDVVSVFQAVSGG